MPKEGSKGKSRKGLNNQDDDPEIPPESLLGRMLRFWDSLHIPLEITKETMVKFCSFFWPEYNLQKGFRWPPPGSDDASLFQCSCLYLNNTEKDLIEKECGKRWLKVTATGIYVARGKRDKGESGNGERKGMDREMWVVLQCLPLPYPQAPRGP